jgi:hypothetical protein
MGFFSKLKKVLDDIDGDDHVQKVQSIAHGKVQDGRQPDVDDEADEGDEAKNSVTSDEEDNGNGVDVQSSAQTEEDEDEDEEEEEEEDEDEVHTREVDEDDERIQELEEDGEETHEANEDDEPTQEVDEDDEPTQDEDEDEDDEQTEYVNDGDEETAEADEDNDKGEDDDEQGATTHDAAQDQKQKDMQRQIQELRTQLSEKPASKDVSHQELQDGSILFMKALVAQLFNQNTNSLDAPITHHDIDHQLVPGDVSSLSLFPLCLRLICRCLDGAKDVLTPTRKRKTLPFSSRPPIPLANPIRCSPN